MRIIQGTRSPIAGVFLVLSLAVFTTALAFAAPVHNPRDLPTAVRATQIESNAFQLAETGLAPALGSDERDREPGAGGRKLQSRLKRETPTPLSSDATPSGLSAAEGAKNAPADPKSDGKNVGDGKTPAAAEASKTPPYIGSKPETRVRRFVLPKSNADSALKPKSAPADQPSPDKPTEPHRFHWQERP